MICSECKKEGKKSTINVGVSSTTLMATHTWYDEDGHMRVDNPNQTTTAYRCSRGHSWTETA